MMVQLAAAAAGVVVMASPSWFGYGGVAADIDHVIGPLAISAGIMAASQILRSLRWANLGFGMMLLGSLLMSGRTGWGSVAIAIAAGILIGTSLVRGRVDTRFGGGWSSLWREASTD